MPVAEAQGCSRQCMELFSPILRCTTVIISSKTKVMKKHMHSKTISYYSLVLLATSAMALAYSCSDSTASPGMQQPPAPALPVLQVDKLPATTWQEYSASLEGKMNVEIRPQVDGYLEKIFVEEGAYVRAGQPLFKINDRVYQEQLSNAKASLHAALANLSRAQVEVDRLTPLVKNNVVSEVQLKTAQAAYEAAQAAVSQAQANVSSAQINLGYTLITAPVSGYIGRIPYKVGSLVGRGENLPLTLVSDVSEIYAWFSLSEVDYLQFKNQYPGATLEEKVKQLPPVELVLADNTIYPEKGKIETVEGQFDKTMGSISFRAVFPNNTGILRSGNTGRVRIPRQLNSLAVPTEATFELQDKVFVFTVADSNKVVSRPISIAGKSGTWYLVDKGIEPGDQIVYQGLDRLQDGMTIRPQLFSTDSLLKTKPL
jgi:RND family efflux transporter, MFP subunit